MMYSSCKEKKQHGSSCSFLILVVSNLLLLLNILYCCGSAAAESGGAAASTFGPSGGQSPALIAFGDSLVDPGNNNGLPTVTKSNFPPYGRDFQGGKATGRFSNGKIITDIIASYMGIKELLPAYLDPNLQNNELLTGVSFASAGAGYDLLTSSLATAIPLPQQLVMFREYMDKLKGAAGGSDERANYIIRNAQYLLVAGNNDIWNSYFTSGIRKSQYDIPSYLDLMVQSASQFTKELYNLGVRKLGIFGLPPIGCVPAERTISGGNTRECAQLPNQACSLFNQKMKKQVQLLNQQLTGSRIFFIDIYNSLLDIIQNPSSYGFEVVTYGCCGTGKVEAEILCNDLNPYTCANDSKYIFWDSFHPTERTYNIIINRELKHYL